MNRINSAVATNKQAAVSAVVLETGRRPENSACFDLHAAANPVGWYMAFDVPNNLAGEQLR